MVSRAFALVKGFPWFWMGPGERDPKTDLFGWRWCVVHILWLCTLLSSPHSSWGWRNCCSSSGIVCLVKMAAHVWALNVYQVLCGALPASIYLILLRQSYEAGLFAHFTEEKTSARGQFAFGRSCVKEDTWVFIGCPQRLWLKWMTQRKFHCDHNNF